MTAVALRGLLTRKLRTALTMIAIILGVSMISGTYVLTDTINAAFLNIFTTADQRIDAVVVAKSIVSSNFSAPPPFPQSLLHTVQTTPGVAQAEGAVADQAQLFDLSGKSIGSTGGAPTLLFSESSAHFPADLHRAGTMATRQRGGHRQGHLCQASFTTRPDREGGGRRAGATYDDRGQYAFWLGG